MDCDAQSDRQEKFRKDAENTLMPAMQTFQYVLRKFANDVDQPLGFKLDFTVSTGGDNRPSAAVIGFVCPNEFGDACRTVTEFFQALGGTCTSSPGNVICELLTHCPSRLLTLNLVWVNRCGHSESIDFRILEP